MSPLMPMLVQLINSTDDEVVTDAMWAMSYIADGDDDHITTVLHSGALPRIVQLLTHPNASIHTPALRTIGNIASGSDNLTAELVQAGVLPLLKAMVKSPRKGIRKEVIYYFNRRRVCTCV